MDLCSVFIVLKFLGKSREKACPLTNHKVKRLALFIKTTVYKLKLHWLCTVAAVERCNQRAENS